MERKLKININKGKIVLSSLLLDKEADLFILNKKIGDKITYKDEEYLITGATSSNGSFHNLSSEVRGRVFIPGRLRKIMVQSKYLDQKTNQIFLTKIE